MRCELAADASSFETQRVTKDGRIFDVWLTVTKLVDDTGKPVGIAFTERDITERIEVLREIKQMRKETPVIMITAYPEEDKVKEAMSEGAYHYIIKPFDLFYLELALITKIIQLSGEKKN